MTKIVILDGYTAIGRSCECQSTNADGEDQKTKGPTNPDDFPWMELARLGTLKVYDRTKPEETVARAAEADIVLTNKVILNREALSQLPRLRYIGVLATGYNVVDIEAAHQCGITVTNVPAYSTESVAQMVFAHLLTVTNRTEHYAVANRNGRWSHNPDFCYWDTELTELAGKTFGVVGLGNIGSRVAQIALAFGMKVKALTSKEENKLAQDIEKATLGELLATSDVISLHCPLTQTTHHIINSDTLKLVKPTAIVINTGRGPLVDDQAMADALTNGQLSAFCADVLSEEPPGITNPLLRHPNAFITPHIAWATREARNRLIQVATENVRAFLNGKPQNKV